MGKVYKIHLTNSNIGILDIPANCNQLQISSCFYENSGNYHYKDYPWDKTNQLFLSNDFIKSLQQAKIEILDMRYCENVEILTDSSKKDLPNNSISFKDLFHLKIVFLPKSLKEMPRFDDCPNLSYIEAENIEALGGNGFHKCPNLVNIKFGNKLKYIGGEALSGSGITHIILPNNNIELYDGAFAKFSSLCSIILPDDIEELKKRTFEGCTNLVKIEGGKNIKDIHHTTFSGCTKLRYLSFHYPFRYHYINNNYFKLNIGYYDSPNEDSFSIGYGIVLDEIDDNAIIWDIENHKFYYGEAKGLVDEVVEFKIVDSVDILYMEGYMVLNRTYKVKDISIIENKNDRNIWILNVIREPISYYLERSFEFPIPFRTFIDKTIDYVNNINIDKIIEDYKTTIYEKITTKVGGDDKYWKLTVRGTSIQDSYINKILPPLYEEHEESGYTTFSKMSNAEKVLIDEDDNRIKQNAREIYSKENHINDIIDNYIQELIDANVTIEENMRLSKAKNILKTLLDRTIMHYDETGHYTFFQKDSIKNYTPEELTKKLNDMLNL